MRKSNLAALAALGPIVGYDGPYGPGATGLSGYAQRADVLVQAADGTNLMEIWDEIAQVLQSWNQPRDTLVSRLTYKVTDTIERVAVPGQTDFEKASEFGQPRGGAGYTYYQRGYDFDFYDLAMRYTWMFLADSNAGQIRNMANLALEADNRLMFNAVLKTIFNPLNKGGIADSNLPTQVVKFYNGDGEVPPIYKNNTFPGSHTHYQTTQSLASSATMTSGVLDAVEADMRKHGYTPQMSGTDLIMLMNPQEAALARTFKVATGAKYDFMPSSYYGGGIYVPYNSGVVARPNTEIPQQVGTYGPWKIVEEEYIPAGYVAAFASGGTFNLQNPVGIREHYNSTMRGLRLIPGSRSDYPLVDSFYQRGFGTGVRQRGAGFIFQVTNSGTYTTPAQYV